MVEQVVDLGPVGRRVERGLGGLDAARHGVLVRAGAQRQRPDPGLAQRRHRDVGGRPPQLGPVERAASPEPVLRPAHAVRVDEHPLPGSRTAGHAIPQPRHERPPDTTTNNQRQPVRPDVARANALLAADGRHRALRPAVRDRRHRAPTAGGAAGARNLCANSSCYVNSRRRGCECPNRRVGLAAVNSGDRLWRSRGATARADQRDAGVTNSVAWAAPNTLAPGGANLARLPVDPLGMPETVSPKNR